MISFFEDTYNHIFGYLEDIATLLSTSMIEFLDEFYSNQTEIVYESESEPEFEPESIMVSIETQTDI